MAFPGLLISEQQVLGHALTPSCFGVGGTVLIAAWHSDRMQEQTGVEAGIAACLVFLLEPSTGLKAVKIRPVP